MLANRLRKRFRHLRKWAGRRGVGAFRLYDRDIPEIPLCLDYYGGAEHPAALAGALYKRPYEKDEAEERRWLAAMRDAAARALAIAPRDIDIKQRERQRGLAQYEKIGERRRFRETAEGGLKFRVNLSDYLDTGLFLDRRLMRAMVRQEAAGRRVLNLFAYTGAFSVYAAAGGAASTDSVDLSNTYLDWAAGNFSLNGFTTTAMSGEAFLGENPAMPDAARHRLIRADAPVFLDRAAAAKRRWDLIILDPPAFSNSKNMSGTLDLRRDHVELLSRCLALLAAGGRLWFSASARGFTSSAAELEAALGARVTDMSGKTVDEDFKGRKTPRTFVIERRI